MYFTLTQFYQIPGADNSAFIDVLRGHREKFEHAMVPANDGSRRLQYPPDKLLIVEDCGNTLAGRETTYGMDSTMPRKGSGLRISTRTRRARPTRRPNRPASVLA